MQGGTGAKGLARKRVVKAKKSPPALSPRMTALSKLTPYRKNPRVIPDTAVAAVAASLKRFGWKQAIVADPKGVIVAGETRYKAAVSLGWKTAPVVTIPARQARAFRVIDNRTSELTSWDKTLLAGELVALDDIEDLNVFDFKSVVPHFFEERRGDPDAVVDLPKKPVARRGDVWVLGRHRLMCGDATDVADVATLLDGCTPEILVTDPPYGVSLDMEWRDRAGINSKKAPAAKSYMRQQGVSGDTIADWSHAFELVPSLNTAYVWHASANVVAVSNGLTRIGFLPRQQLIWVKPYITIGRSHYNWRHEPCWYAFKIKHAKWVGPANSSTIWELSSPKMSSSPADDKTPHPTQKPVECMQWPIHNHRGDVYDPFVGSGTTVIAGELEERHVFAMELEPAYVDVTVKRWEDFTGKKATLKRKRHGKKTSHGPTTAHAEA